MLRKSRPISVFCLVKKWFVFSLSSSSLVILYMLEYSSLYQIPVYTLLFTAGHAFVFPQTLRLLSKGQPASQCACPDSIKQRHFQISHGLSHAGWNWTNKLFSTHGLFASQSCKDTHKVKGYSKNMWRFQQVWSRSQLYLLTLMLWSPNRSRRASGVISERDRLTQGSRVVLFL